MTIETLLYVEIEDEFSKLKDMEVGTDEYKTTVDCLTKLVDRAIEIDKLNIENEEKTKDRENDNGLKLKQMKEERNNHIVQNCIAVASIVASTALAVWGTKASFKFEETGTVTTIMGRGFINKLLPKK